MAGLRFPELHKILTGGAEVDHAALLYSEMMKVIAETEEGGDNHPWSDLYELHWEIIVCLQRSLMNWVNGLVADDRGQAQTVEELPNEVGSVLIEKLKQIGHPELVTQFYALLMLHNKLCVVELRLSEAVKANPQMTQSALRQQLEALAGSHGLTIPEDEEWSFAALSSDTIEGVCDEIMLSLDKANGYYDEIAQLVQKFDQVGIFKLYDQEKMDLDIN